MRRILSHWRGDLVIPSWSWTKVDILLNLPAVNSHHDLKGLQHPWLSQSTCERTPRTWEWLQTLMVVYWQTSILMNKLPLEIWLIVSWELTEENWDVEKLMKIIDQVDARESSATSCCPNPVSSPRSHSRSYMYHPLRLPSWLRPVRSAFCQSCFFL